MKLVQDRNQIYWTPNTIASNVIINGDHALIELTSVTPNLEDYEMFEFPSVRWSRTDSIFVIDLKKKRYELIVRAENLAGVAGPEHRIVIDRH